MDTEIDKESDTETSPYCLIISANTVVSPYPVYPLGAACLAGALRRQGHRVDHFDILAEGGLDKLEERLRRASFDLIGVSIRNLDSVDSTAPTPFLKDIRNTIDCIRKNCRSPIVLGGAGFSIMPNELMELLGSDYGIVGEGEILLPWLTEELAHGRPPTQKIFSSQPTERVWAPLYINSTTANFYVNHGGMLNVQTKRGCPYKCSYCTYPAIEGRTVRYRDADDVAEEINLLRDDSGARYIFFADSFFNDQQGHFLKVAEALIRHGNTLPWCAFFRPDGLTKSDLRLLKRSGLAAMEVGTDAASDKTLSELGKNFTFAQVLKAQNQIAEEGIPCAHFVMFGGPGEDQQTLSEGLKNIELLTPSVVFAFVGIRILPRTPLHQRAIEEGIIDRKTSLVEPEFYYSPKIDRETITESIKSSFAGKLDRVFPCHEFDNRVKTLHAMGHVGPLWDFILKTKNNRK